MIIRTDLYAVHIDGRKQPRNRAGKITAAILGAILTLTVLDAWLISGKRQHLKLEETTLKSQLLKLDKDLAVAQLKANELAKKRKFNKTLLQFANARVSWAPLLESIFAVLPENVQLTALSGKSTSQDDCLLQISGKIFGTQARLEADKFRTLCLEALAQIKAKAEFDKLEELEPKPDSPLQEAEFEISIRWKNGNPS